MYVNIIPKCTDLFSGRERELKVLEKAFYETNLFHIEGILGVGKTSLMQKWANILNSKPEYKDRVLWIECQEDWTTDNVLMEMNNWLVSIGDITVKEHLNEQSFDDIKKLMYFTNLLNKNNYIIFIDDSDNINFDASRFSQEMLRHFIKYIRTFRVYIISDESVPFSPDKAMDIFRLRVKGLEQDDSLLLIEKFLAFHDSKAINNRNMLINIVNKSKGHPFTLKSLLTSIISGVFTYDELIKEEDPEKYIGNIFFNKLISNLDIDEKNVVEILAVCRIPLSVKNIKEIININNLSKIILSLDNKMIIEKEKNVTYLLQPILREYILYNLTEDRKFIIHNILGEYFERHEEFHLEAFYHRINGGKPDNARDIFQKFAKNLCHLGYYKEILNKLELLETNIPLTEEMKILKANILIKRGNCREGFSMLEDLKNKIINKNLLGEVYFSMARHYSAIGEVKKAIEFGEKSLESFQKGNAENMIKVTNFIDITCDVTGISDGSDELLNFLYIFGEREDIDITQVYSLRKDVKDFFEDRNFEKILDTIDIYLKMLEKNGDFYFISWAMYNKGKALLKLNRYDEAYECFENNLFSGKKRGDNIVVAYSYLGIGWTFYEKGDLEKAFEFFKESMNNFLYLEHNICAAYCEYNLACIMFEKREFSRAISLYSKIIDTARKFSDKKLELSAEIQIMENKIRIKELWPNVKDIIKIKKHIPQDFINERLSINLILGYIYHNENKEKEKNEALIEAMKLSEKTNDFFVLAKTFLIMSKISNKSKDEKEFFKQKTEENFNKLTSCEKRLLDLFCEINEEDKEMFLIKTCNENSIVSVSEIEKFRKEKDKFEFFIDIPGRCGFEKNKGEINIFRKKILLSILLFLIKNEYGGTSDEIYREVWGLGYDNTANRLDVRKYISRLRDLIEPDERNFKYILYREGSIGENGRYFFNNKVKFCFIDKL